MKSFSVQVITVIIITSVPGSTQSINAQHGVRFFNIYFLLTHYCEMKHIMVCKGNWSSFFKYLFALVPGFQFLL